MATKYIFVTGGVVSGLGKGITAASLGRLLKTRGLKVASQKLDPYINVDPGTKMADCYGTTEIDERHRHRYEFNNEFRAEFEEKGLVIAGTSPDGRLVEAVEIPGRDFHLGAQFHPEFKSRPNRAHPLFKGFIAAALKFQSEHTPTGHPAVLGE